MALELTDLGQVPTADQLAIEATLLRYSLGIDAKEWELFKRCFTPECHAVYGDLEYRSRDELSDAFEELHAPLDDTLHRMGNFTLISYGGDVAHTRIYGDVLLYREGAEGGDELRVVGWYADDLVRAPEGWQIESRRFRAVRYEGNFNVFGDASIAEQGYADADA